MNKKTKHNVRVTHLKAQDKTHTHEFKWDIRVIPLVLLFIVFYYFQLDLVFSILFAFLFSILFSIRKECKLV